LEGKSRMGDHLTPTELDAVIVRCKHEMMSGAGTLILAGAAFVISSLVGFILVASGAGLIAHGYSTRRQALEAKRSFPSAQVVSR